MRALITGATGFVGLHLAEHLLSLGDEVIGASREMRWPPWTSPAVRSGVRLDAWDLAVTPGADVTRRWEAFQPEVVYHLAAMSVQVDCGEKEPNDRAMAINVGGTERLIAWMVSRPAPRPRLVYVSSSAVYAPVSADAPPIREDWPLAPPRGYGQTKLAAERLVRAAVLCDGLSAVMVRAFAHTGPGQSTRMVVPDWASQFAAPGDRPIRTQSLDTFLDLSDVRDVVRAYRELALRGTPGEAYNLGSGVRSSGREIMAILERAARQQGLSEKRAIIESDPGPRYRPIADITRLKRTIDWSPRFSLEQTILDTFAFWRHEIARQARADSPAEQPIHSQGKAT